MQRHHSIAKHPELDLVRYFGSDLYYLPMNPLCECSKLQVPGFEGACDSPVFSPDGKSVAFVKTKQSSTWCGNYQLFVIHNIDSTASSPNLFAIQRSETWPLSPQSVRWSYNYQELFLIAQDQGRGKLYKIPVTTDQSSLTPKALSSTGSVLEVYSFEDPKVASQMLVTKSIFIDSSIYSLIDPSAGSERLVSNFSGDGSGFGVSNAQNSEFWSNSRGDYRVHAFLIKPSSFDSKKCLSSCLPLPRRPRLRLRLPRRLEHDLVIAEQGYIVVLPNFSGSTGYGADFTAAIKGQWLCRPYKDIDKDIVQCFEHVETELPFADTIHAVSLGGSYGAVMLNWIAGQPLDKKFLALAAYKRMLNRYVRLVRRWRDGLRVWFRRRNLRGEGELRALWSRSTYR